MEVRRLGHHGLALSALTLGTLTWGRDTDDIEAAQMLSSYMDEGGTTIDVPSDWASPAFSGRVDAIGQVCQAVPRDDLVLLLHSGSLSEPTGDRLTSPRTNLGPRTSNRNLLASLDQALADLRTNFVDLWIIHGPRQGVAIDEIKQAAAYALRTGRTRYVGIADFDDWDLGALSSGSDRGEGLTIAALSESFSLLDSGARLGRMRHGRELGLGFVALAPLAQGVLTGKYRHSTPPDSRAATAHLASLIEPYLTPRHGRVVEAAVRAAEGLDVSPTQVALAWVLAQPTVTTAVIGPRNTRQLNSILEQPVLSLQRELRDVLTEVSVP